MGQCYILTPHGLECDIESSSHVTDGDCVAEG